MWLEWKIRTNLSRLHLDDYLQEITVDARAGNDQENKDYAVARLKMTRMLWGHALDDGVRTFDICDADSQGLLDAQISLTDGLDKFRDDLQIKDMVWSVLFMYRAVFHPDVAKYRQLIIDSAFNMFDSSDSLAVMWVKAQECSETELAELGFKKIDNGDLAYRHNALASDFGDKYPRGVDVVEVQAFKAHNDWVDARLKPDFVGA